MGIFLVVSLGVGGFVAIIGLALLWLPTFPRSPEKEAAIRSIRENGEVVRHAMDELLVQYQQTIEGMRGGTDGNQ